MPKHRHGLVATRAISLSSQRQAGDPPPRWFFPYFLLLNRWFHVTARNQRTCPSRGTTLITRNLMELIHLPSVGNPLRKSAPIGKENAARSVGIQPKFCATLYGCRRKALPARDLWKTSVCRVGYYFPEDELKWRRSPFTWARGNSRLRSCCCRAVTMRKLPRSSRWPGARSRHTSIVSSFDLESGAVLSA